MAKTPKPACATKSDLSKKLLASRPHGPTNVRFGSFASIFPCPLSRPLSTAPDITTSGRDPSACRFPAPVLQTTGTAAAAPASWLRSIWRHVTPVRSPTIQHIDCNKLASDLRPECWSGFLFDRRLAKDFAGTARPRPPTERWQDKRHEVRGGWAAEKHRQIRYSARGAEKHDSVPIRPTH